MSKAYSDRLRFQPPPQGRLARKVGGLLLTLGVLTPLLTGCGAAEGTVSGRVLFNGTGLPGGRVTFRPADPQQNAVQAVIDANGNYELTAPTGEGVFIVDNRELKKVESLGPPNVPGFKTEKKINEAPQETPGKIPGQYVEIPAKYYTAENSGLKYTVQSGAQKYDIELK